MHNPAQCLATSFTFLHTLQQIAINTSLIVLSNLFSRNEDWKNQMEDREEAFKEASTRLMIVSHNITETIIKLAAFDASKATLEEVLE